MTSYDNKITISTGRSRRETHWVNHPNTLWSKFVEKLSHTHRTAETCQDYLTSDKSRQDEIKDIGGFVGGHINGGRRKQTNITERHLITLDTDFAPNATLFWNNCKRIFGCAAVIYSTHKHTPQTPRLRLILPLSRPVMSDEYVPIARRVAGELGIDNFDDTTYEPARLMYWPSTSSDGEYFFGYHDAPWLDPDTLLATYHDWRDAREWPHSDRSHHAIRHNIKQLGNPAEKPGITGIFCRVYGIREAIDKYLADTYTPCDQDDRYTYRQGSATAGLVIYDNRYAYSHHSTDPASGRLCNAFDLVRIHLHGLRDLEAKPDTPINRLPSNKAMLDQASKDPAVRHQAGLTRLAEAQQDFAHTTPETPRDPKVPVPEDPKDWLSQMSIDTKGNYKLTINNIKLILDNDPALRNAFALDRFHDREIATRDLPWRKITPATCQLTDTDDAGLRDYIERIYDLTGLQKIKDALALTVEKNAFHPVREYLDSLRWDGLPRIDTLLTEYLAAEDTPYTRAVTRKTLVAAVARIYKPGIKFDYVLVITGRQGAGKSSLIKKLGREWFSDTFSAVQNKEAYEQIQGVWIMEISELAGLKKAEIETVKHFISKQEDNYRAAYGRRTQTHPRQCIFIGTTNESEFLRDHTGNRRFWPVETGNNDPERIFSELDDSEISQIWAEAVTLYRAGEALHLTQDVEDQAAEKQEIHRETDDRKGLIEEFLEHPLPENWEEMDIYARRNYLTGDPLTVEGTVKRQKVCIAEIWCELFGKPQSEMTSGNTKELHRMMRSIEGWQPIKNKKHNAKFKLYGDQRGYERI
jgi:predicted P-loop ATPase